MGGKPWGDMRKFFVGEGGARWCGWPVTGSGGVDVRGVVLLQKTRRPKGGVWTAWGTVSVHAGLEGRACEGDTETRPLIYEDTPRQR